MKNIFLTFVLFVIGLNSYAQPTLTWSKDFEAGLDNYYSQGPTVQTENGTVKVIGRKNADDSQRLAVIVYNLEGEIISSASFGNDISNSTVIDYKFDSDNQLYLLMQEKIGFYKSNIVLQKYSSDGSLAWTARIHDDSAVSYKPCSIGLTSGNSIFINGYKETDYPEFPTDEYITFSVPYMYAYDTSGSLIWQREFEVNSGDVGFAHKIFMHDDIAFLFFSNYKLAKIDSGNNLTLIDTVGIYDGINDVYLTTDNNLLITAATKYKITKTNLDGASFWVREYGTFLPSNNIADEMRSVTQDTDGNIYITGRHYGHNIDTPSFTNADILTLKYNSSGTLIWQNRYQYGVNNADIGNFITLKNGYIYVGGESERAGVPSDYDYVFLKINASTGATDHVYRYNAPSNGDDSISSICVLDNGDFALTGLSYINSQYDWTTQFFSDHLSVQDNEIKDNSEISPNPVSAGSVLNIGGKFDDYKLFSPIGQIVQSGNLNTDNQKILVGNIAAGIYLLRLENETGKTIKKVIVK